jgi:aminopeptidase N
VPSLLSTGLRPSSASRTLAHHTDAAGHVLAADRGLEMNSINRQIAARLPRVMDRWSRLAESGPSAAREDSNRVAARADVSNDVREIVGRAPNA